MASSRPDPTKCKSLRHDWVEDNLVTRHSYDARYGGKRFEWKSCVLCEREYRGNWARLNRKPRNKRTKIAGSAFNIHPHKITEFIRMVFVGGTSIRMAARKVGIAKATAENVYWAERDRRQMEATAQR